MKLEDALRAAMCETLRDCLPRLLDEHLGQDRLIPIDQTHVSRRLLMDAARAGELTIYARGNAKFVRADQLTEWILKSPECRSGAPDDATDEVASLVEQGEKRRRKK